MQKYLITRCVVATHYDTRRRRSAVVSCITTGTGYNWYKGNWSVGDMARPGQHWKPPHATHHDIVCIMSSRLSSSIQTLVWCNEYFASDHIATKSYNLFIVRLHSILHNDLIEIASYRRGAAVYGFNNHIIIAVTIRSLCNM